MLNAISHVSLNITFVINPIYSKFDNSVWYAEAFNKVYTLKFGMFVVLFFNGFQHL